jgi:TPP-dependent pyruvate/acetoin dehydrogenase alpha subunit
MKFSKKDLVTLYANLVRARAFDELFTSRLEQGKLLAFYHRSEGQEAPGVGACSFLRKDDILYHQHRGHGMPEMLSKGMDMKYFLAEHTGKSTGTCRGMSSFHGMDQEYHDFGFCGLIGSNFPVSVGYGLAAKKNNRGQVVVNLFGDGGSNRGTLHEAFLMSNNWKLPIVWICVNNGVAQFVPVKDSHPVEDIADLAKGYGMPGIVVDGQDVIAVAEVVNKAVELARKGKGPMLIECKAIRFCPHYISAPDMYGCEERSKEEIEELKKRDPIILCREKLLAQKILTKKSIENIDMEVAAELKTAEAFADESPIPDPNTFDQMLYAS